jgi:hypothetical protein
MTVKGGNIIKISLVLFLATPVLLHVLQFPVKSHILVGRDLMDSGSKNAANLKHKEICYYWGGYQSYTISLLSYNLATRHERRRCPKLIIYYQDAVPIG